VLGVLMELKSPRKVLAIDDERQILDILTSYFRDAGDRFTLDTVTNATQALELISDQEYDLILSDLDMPNIKGPELVNKISEVWSHPRKPKVCYLTGTLNIDVLKDAIGTLRDKFSHDCEG